MSTLRYGFLTVAIAAAAAPALAQDLTVMMGELPPHMDADGNGREAEIIRAVADACG